MFKARLGLAVVALGMSIASVVMAVAPVEEAEPDALAPATNQVAAPSRDRAMMMLVNKIQAMQQEMQKLRGQLEVQAHDLRLMEQQQRAFYQDLNLRVAKTENSLTKVAEARANAVVAATAIKQAVSAKAAMSEAQPATKIAKKIESANTPKAQYQQAYKLIKGKNYSDAEKALRGFIEAYPRHELTANAHYWLGELLINRGQYDEAIKQFNLVIDQFGNSPKRAAAMLKLGYAYFRKGEFVSARGELGKVKKQYPNSTTARLASARLLDMDKRGL